MGNHVSAANLGNAVNVLLGTGAINLPSDFTQQAFMDDLAEVICRHVGGELIPSRRLFDSDSNGVTIETTGNHDSPRKAFWSDFVTPSSTSYNSARTLSELALQATRRDIFSDLLSAGKLQIDGKPAIMVSYRGDLIAQERINAAPRSTIIDQHLFEVRPDLLKACREMCRDFVVEDWAGRHLEEFASEYAKGPDHDKTIVLHLMGTLERQAKLTLEALWNAQPIAPGAWRIGAVTISRGA